MKKVLRAVTHRRRCIGSSSHAADAGNTGCTEPLRSPYARVLAGGTGAAETVVLPQAAAARARYSNWRSRATPYPEPSPNLDQANPSRFQPFAALDDIRNNSLSFAEAREARVFKSGDMHEHVLAAAIPSDEAEALLDVEPLDRARLLDGRPARYRS